MQACSSNFVAGINHLEWIQNYKAGNWHSSPPLRRETAMARPSFPAAATNSGWPYYHIHNIHGVWIRTCFFLPPTRCGHRGHSYKLLQDKSHRRRRGSVFLAFYFRLNVSLCLYIREKVGTGLHRGSSITSPYNHVLPEHSSPQLPTRTSTVNIYHFFTLSNYLYCLYGFFRPIVAYFLPL